MPVRREGPVSARILLVRPLLSDPYLGDCCPRCSLRAGARAGRRYRSSATPRHRSLPYSAFDKLQRVSHAAIVENKRLGEILAWIKELQDRQPRLNTIPKGPRRSSQTSGLLKNRALRMAEVAKSNSKAPRQGRHRSDMVVSAAPAHAPSDAAE